MHHTPLSYYHYTLELLARSTSPNPHLPPIKPLPLPSSLHLTAMASSLTMLLLMLRFSGATAVSPSYISRTTELQVIATVAPAAFADDADAGQSAGQPFLTSPSGSYAAYLRRGVDGSGSSDGPAGGGDVCYVEVVQQGGSSVWESDCTPVGGADPCDLAFSTMGLELFAGGHSLWDTGVDADPRMLSLDGAGDLMIVSKDGVTVWSASGDPWTGQRCGAASPVSSSSTDVLPPPSKVLTPPVSTFVGPWGTDFSFGDQPAPPLDTSPDQFLPPPPADASTDSPYMPVPPAPADSSTDSPDLPLPPPSAAMYPIPETPYQPLYSSPPPAPTAFVPQTPLPPPLDTPPLAPPTTGNAATSPDTPSPSIATPPESSGTDDTAFPPPPVGTPHPHHLPFGASAPVPGALAPNGSAHGAGTRRQGNPQHAQRQGLFGQQQNLNGAGQPLENSSGRWSTSDEHRAAMVVLPSLAALVSLAFNLY